MNPQKEYALLCEFLTQSANGLYSYLHVFDRTNFKEGAPLMLNANLAVRFRGMPDGANLEIYMTDDTNTLLDKGTVFKQQVKGSNVHIIAKIRGLVVPRHGEYRFAARIDGGEPVALCAWMADKAPVSS
ncbi:hypothetical protein HYS28_03285 [Candidatus Uhrbacteria bacterium]|nr:hypothetical protein [Candidatus Uhrbacteria bacterium]